MVWQTTIEAGEIDIATAIALDGNSHVVLAGWTDSDDPDCDDDGTSEDGYGSTECNDGVDNDGNLAIDSADDGCEDASDCCEGLLHASELRARLHDPECGAECVDTAQERGCDDWFVGSRERLR